MARRRIKQGEEFVFSNGKTAKTISECKKILKTLTAEEFASYVNNQKNDIYNWINNCIDPELAEKIKDIKDQKELVKLLK